MMKNFKEEIENSGMSFTEGGSYEPKDKNEIFLNLALCSEEERKEVFAILPKTYGNEYTIITKYHYLHFRKNEWYVGVKYGIKNKTAVSFTQFMEIMGATVEDEKVEIFDIDFGGNCMARMEIQNGKFKFTYAMNGGGYPIAIEDIKITRTN